MGHYLPTRGDSLRRAEVEAMNLYDLLFNNEADARSSDAVRVYLAERNREPGIPHRILSPALMLALLPTWSNGASMCCRVS